jgi:DNA adenine methylase
MVNLQYDLFDGYENISGVKPLLKWVGGKRSLLPILREYMSPFYTKCARYVEPFLGGGAVLFDLKPTKAVINDVNSELICVYKSIRDNPLLLISLLIKHRDNHSVDYYYYIRNLDRDTPCYKKLSDTEKAARIIYLNKTCFNGLYRVNRNGQFNVPIGGSIAPEIVNEATILSINNFFTTNNIIILNKDFESITEYLDKNDFIYLDPPYDTIKAQSFVSYSIDGFSRDDQCRLKSFCDHASSIGCKIMLSNAYTDFIMDLYKDYTIKVIKAPRFVGASAESRGLVEEVVVMNF